MGIVRPILEEFPYAWMFFVPFIMTATFTMLNLFIAVIVEAMQSQATAAQARQKRDIEQLAEEKERLLHEEIEGLRRDIGELKQVLVGRHQPAGDPGSAGPAIGGNQTG